ncbi:MAG TPA: ARMT1-like domain-containing protein [Methanocorpusculum sp.]|nr:ARMT1-like domain-containing protein [Methanocorpusculum sp.]
MKLALDCRDCLMNKVRSQASAYISDAALLTTVVGECERIFDEGAAKNEGAAVTAGRIHRYCYSVVHEKDLYQDIKDRDNRRAVDVLNAVSSRIVTLHDALIASVLGNAMDYGVTGHTVAENFTEFFSEIFSHGLALDDSADFFRKIDRVVYFTDNCGEVIFDMRFIEELKKNGSHVTVVVKDGPMLNDVTMREARMCGVDTVADALFIGGEGQLLGSHPPHFPQEVREAVDRATLIIAKGLANYESLTEYVLDKPVAYLMMIKCDAVGRHITETYGRPAKKGDLVAFLGK